MVKILLAMSGLGGGGITSMLTQYVKYLNHDFHVDFLVYKGTDRNNAPLYRQYGCKIFEVSNPVKNYFSSRNETIRILRSGRYDIIHSCNFLNSGFLVKFAKEAGVKGRIVHSHASAPYHQGLIYNMYQNLMRRSIYSNSTLLLACSMSAGRYLFNNQPFTILPNAIEADRYTFDSDKRKSIRKEYNIADDTFVIGTVAMIDQVKNQSFLIKILEKMDDDCILMIVGDGNFREKLMGEIHEKKMEDRVIITGWKESANQFYSAFDCFVLPSFSEGFPVVSLEAQANGLFCLVSDRVTKEIDAGDTVVHIGIEENDLDNWIREISNVRKNGRGIENAILGTRYDIKNNIKELETVYRDSMK